MVTIFPRIGAGEISAIYMGAAMDAAPTPMPPNIRNTINWLNVSGNAVPNADIKKKIPANTKVFFLPNLSLSKPAIATPIMQPTSAEEAAQPVAAGVNSKWNCKSPIAPEITAVSYPNNSPPSAATRVIRNT